MVEHVPGGLKISPNLQLEKSSDVVTDNTRDNPVGAKHKAQHLRRRASSPLSASSATAHQRPAPRRVSSPASLSTAGARRASSPSIPPSPDQPVAAKQTTASPSPSLETNEEGTAAINHGIDDSPEEKEEKLEMLKNYTVEPTHVTQINGDHRGNERAAGSSVWRGPTLGQNWKEIQRQGYLGSPMVATNMLWFARYMVSTAFLGKLGGLELAAGTLALTFSNIAGWSVLIGLASGMEAIFSQAYGAGKHEVLGPTLKRGFAVLLMASIPVAVLWCKAEGLLLLTGQAPLLCKEAQRYLYYLLPDLLATCFIAPLRIFLRSQCITKPLVLCSVLALCLHIPLNYLLVLKLGMGAPGTAVAICVTDFALAGLLIVYLVHFHLGRPINGHSFAQFFRIHVNSATERALSWGALLKLALPCCLMTCMEGWCYEIIVLLTGFLPQAKEAVETVAIVLNGDTIFYAMEVALASCVSARVGNELGAKRPVKAYQATVAALWVSMVLGFGGAGWLMLSSRMAWGRFFTKDVKVLKNVAEILPIMAFIELANFPQNVACGALRGSGRQTVGALINFAAFYVIGIPLAILLGFKFKLGLLGLWIGLATAAAITAILGITVVLRTDWGFQSIRAEELTNQQMLSAQESSRKDNPELYATVPQGDPLSMDSSYPEDIYDGDSKVHEFCNDKPDLNSFEQPLAHPTEDVDETDCLKIDSIAKRLRSVEDQFADGNWKLLKTNSGKQALGRCYGSAKHGNLQDGHCWEVSMSMMNESARKCAMMARLEEERPQSKKLSCCTQSSSTDMKRAVFNKLRLFGSKQKNKKAQVPERRKSA